MKQRSPKKRPPYDADTENSQLQKSKSGLAALKYAIASINLITQYILLPT